MKRSAVDRAEARLFEWAHYKGDDRMPAKADARAVLSELDALREKVARLEAVAKQARQIEAAILDTGDVGEDGFVEAFLGPDELTALRSALGALDAQ